MEYVRVPEKMDHWLVVSTLLKHISQSQYMENKQMFQTTNQLLLGMVLNPNCGWFIQRNIPRHHIIAPDTT